MNRHESKFRIVGLFKDNPVLALCSLAIIYGLPQLWVLRLIELAASYLQ